MKKVKNFNIENMELLLCVLKLINEGVSIDQIDAALDKIAQSK